MIIAIDIGDTLLNRFAQKDIVLKGGGFTYPMFDGVLYALKQLKEAGHKLVIISKINQGDNEKILRYVLHHRITPNFIDIEDIHFCHEWDEKGPIAKQIGATVVIDDRVEVHNKMAECGVPHRILFLEGHDDRKNSTLTTSVLEAHNWCEVVDIVKSLPL